MAAWEFQTLQNIAKQNGWHQFISMQDYYSMVHREIEREMIPYCKDAGVGLTPYSPVARGLLTRPCNSAPTKRQESDMFAEFLLGKTTSADIEIIGRVEELAKKKGVAMATIAIAWCITKGVYPIVGLNSIERVDQAVESIAFAKSEKLAKEDIEFLEEKYIPKAPIVAV
jgi:aryl-alcohol dehydrogenase-like predicted oxidoreductase